MTTFDLSAFVPYQLAVAAARVSRGFAERYRDEFGLSIPEWRVLAHLSQEGAVSVREIHLRVDMDKSKVSRAAKRLQEAGYVEKSENASDRRLVRLSLTGDGKALMARILPVAMRYQDEVLAALGPDAAAFRTGLDVLISAGGPGAAFPLHKDKPGR